MRPDRLLPGGLGSGDRDRAGLFALAGPAPAPHPNRAVPALQQIAVMDTFGLSEAPVGVADGGISPAAGPGVQVAPVGFDPSDLLADLGECFGDVGRDQSDEPVLVWAPERENGTVLVPTSDELGAYLKGDRHKYRQRLARDLRHEAE